MSGGFTGFSDIDIKKMKTRIARTDENSIKEFRKINSDQDTFMINEKNSCERTIQNAPMENISLAPAEPVNVEVETNNNTSTRESQENGIVHDEAVYLPVEKPINMQEFQLQQKLIEEQNRMKKEMLSKALEDREKQNAEEVVRIEHIKKELQTLDVQLSGDVSMLRKQIDKCSLSFMEAEKNYNKIEMEFLAAKMLLQKERERKELLTEHLCTLIAHNEARKAKKLEFLMDKLVYKLDATHPSVDGVCEQTGKFTEIENNEVKPSDN